jgi:DNA-binding PadR family transcriptional regulator
MKMAGRDVVILTTLTEKSRTVYDIKMAFTIDGGTPTTVVEGSMTKIGA